MPSTLESIGDSAFYDCYGLTKVVLPNSVKEKWHVYRNGRNTGEGRYDYRETVQAIQKPKE